MDQLLIMTRRACRQVQLAWCPRETECEWGGGGEWVKTVALKKIINKLTYTSQKTTRNSWSINVQDLVYFNHTTRGTASIIQHRVRGQLLIMMSLFLFVTSETLWQKDIKLGRFKSVYSEHVLCLDYKRIRKTTHSWSNCCNRTFSVIQSTLFSILYKVTHFILFIFISVRFYTQKIFTGFY